MAADTTAPVPITALVLLPSLAVLKTTALLKLAALPGAKRTARLVEPKPGRLNGVPDRIVKGPPLTMAVPLLKAAAPRLVTTKAAETVCPTATVPKSSAGGETASCAGVKPTPMRQEPMGEAQKWIDELRAGKVVGRIVLSN